MDILIVFEANENILYMNCIAMAAELNNCIVLQRILRLLAITEQNEKIC